MYIYIYNGIFILNFVIIIPPWRKHGVGTLWYPHRFQPSDTKGGEGAKVSADTLYLVFCPHASSRHVPSTPKSEALRGADCRAVPAVCPIPARQKMVQMAKP